MPRRKGNSSGTAYIFVSVNLVLLLIFILAGVENLQNVHDTITRYDGMLHAWYTVRLEFTDLDPGDALSSLPTLERFTDMFEQANSSPLIRASSQLSGPLNESSRELELAWRNFISVGQEWATGSAGPASMRMAQERLQSRLFVTRAAIEELVETQERALTVLLYCLGATVAVVIVVFVIVELEAERSRQAALQNSRLAMNTLGIQEAERTRIAHDLHDSLAQDLSVAVLEAESIAGTARDQPAVALSAAQSLRARLGTMIGWVRNLAYELHPPEIDAVGLVPAVQRYCEEQAVASNVKIHVNSPAEPTFVDERAAINLYRIVQEAVTNALRHGQPALVQVNLEQKTDRVVVTVRDDGRGIQEGSNKSSPTGLGIAGMKERALMLGATFKVTSHRGRGTTISCSIPTSTEDGDPPHG